MVGRKTFNRIPMMTERNTQEKVSCENTNEFFILFSWCHI